MTKIHSASLLRQLEVIRGYDTRGFNTEGSVLTQTADGADLNRMWSEFQQTLNIFNRDGDALVNFLTYKVEKPTERILYPTGGDFEEASEYGEPVGIRNGTPFIMGFPFKWYDLAIRYTWKFLAEAQAAQVESLNNEALAADSRLQMLQVLKAIFNNVNVVANIHDVAVNCYRLYNADGTVPPQWKKTTHLGNHTHYLVSGAATVDAGDLQDMEDHLYHHGYTINRGYKLVLMVNRVEGATIRTFRITTPGTRYDFIPKAGYGGGVIMPQGMGIVGQPGGEVPGEIGTYGPFHVVEEDWIPAHYMLAFVTGGEKNLGNLVGIREHEQTSLRGLQLVKGRDNDYPLTDAFYRHGLGAAVRHRGAGVVMQVKAAGNYDIPAAYV